MHNQAFCEQGIRRIKGASSSGGGRERNYGKGQEDGNREEIAPAFAMVEDVHAVKAMIDSQGESIISPPRTEVTLLIAKARVCNPEGEMEGTPAESIYLFFDSGSQGSYITKALAKKLGLKKLSEKEISVCTFGSTNPKRMKVSMTQIDVILRNGERKSLQVDAIPLITNPMERKALKKEDAEFIKKMVPGEIDENLPLNPEIVVPDMLIGADYLWGFLEEKMIIKCPSGLHLIPTTVGLLVSGSQVVKQGTVAYGTLTALNGPDEYMMSKESPIESTLSTKKVEEMWALDTIGITDPPKENEDEHALQQFNREIKYDEGRYWVGWPFKLEAPILPDNYGLCKGRLKSLMIRLQGDPDLLQKYNAIIVDQLQKGIIERVDEGMETGPLQHYLPHHPVVTPSKTTTKVRIVYDASARINRTSKSLNDCLYRGPIMLPNLCGLLIRFRMNRVAITADVEKAFLQIGLLAPDRDVARFLWVKEIDKPFSPGNIQEYRFTRVTFGVISSPFLLSATLQYHLNQVGSENAHKIAENTYVDNILMGAKSVQEACQLYDEAKSIFAKASMNLQEWGSNSREFTEAICEDDRLKERKAKVLGILWDTVDDTLQLSLATILRSVPATKREVLQSIASTFDPLGFLAPVILKGKILFQQLCLEKYDWDDQLSDHLNLIWSEIQEDWEKNSTYILPQLILPEGEEIKYHLLTFVDASMLAYVAAVYLRIETKASTEVHLLFSKNRLAPKKTKITLPQLELLAMLIGVRATKFVEQQLKLPLEKKIIWSDSECVLHWIQSSKPLATFVANRIKEIREAEDLHFRYVPTLENPADLSTRGVKAAHFNEELFWWEGPEWLKKSDEWWPEGNIPELTPKVLKEIESEEKGVKSFHEATLVSVNAIEEFKPLVDASRVSSWPKLIRITVYCLRFLKQKIWNKLTEEKKEKFASSISSFRHMKEKGLITVRDIRIATVLTLKQAQKQHFGEIYLVLKGKVKNQMVDQLGVQVKEDGLLRCQERMLNADLPQEAREPILLPRKTPVTSLIILHEHQLALHNGVQHTLAQIRMKYWVPKGRSEVQQIIRGCLICHKYTAAPYSLPRMPPLPRERVSRAQPFQYTGLDYLGPLLIKLADDRKKVWICLFTCMVTRAIHLELVLDLSSGQFLSCVRRFIVRRGRPEKIISDNAPSFKLAQKTMELAWKVIIQDETTLSYFAQQEIDWRFITEYAPWQGGFYKRLVGSVKKTMRKVIGKKCLELESLYTLLPEVEAVLNSRPLTYVYDDFESRQVLRPIDFQIPKGEIGIPPLEEDPENEEYIPPGADSKQKLFQMWKKSLANLDKFWALWYDEYLLSLRERTQLLHKGPRLQADATPRLNEIVLIKEEGAPRGVWKMGKIIELKKGRDGEIRTAKVLLANKSTFTRPISLLFPLELSSEEGIEPSAAGEAGQKEAQEARLQENDTQRPRRSPRLAAKKQSSNVFYILSLISLMLSVFLTGVQGVKCPPQARLKKVQSQKCVTEGVVIFRTEEGNLCWRKRKCPTGHLQGDGQCGPPCQCPEWAEECSHYEGPLPTDDGKTTAILNLAQPSVCSFEPDTRCNEKPTHVRLHRIQLYDNSLHYVRNLKLRRAQVVTQEFECIGEGPQVGTSAFCERHDCAISGTKFCYYQHNEVVFFTNEDGEIPIKAWGIVPVTVYGPKEVPPENPSCLECALKCVQGGVEILLEDNMGMIEACSKPYCYKISHPKKVEMVLFPKDVVINTHEITVKVWSNGYVVKDFGIQCDPSPYCEMIQCYLCWNLIGNPQCAPKWALLLLFTMLYFGSMTLYVLVKMIKYGCQCCFYGGYFSWKCLQFCRSVCRQARSKTYEKVYLPAYAMFQRETADGYEEEKEMDRLQRVPPPEVKKKYQSSRYKSIMKKDFLSIMTLLMTFSLVGRVETCSTVTTMTAQQTMCSMHEGGSIECVLTEATRLALVPQGQDSCLMIRDPTGLPIGTLAVEVEGITLECMAVNEYYTRSFEMKVASSKRCFRAGSCGDNQCGGVNLQSMIEELAGEPNDSPRFTYCTASCGCAGCDCFYCVTGCLFYRTYASPLSDTTYEVFSCPVWQYKVKATIRLTLPGENLQQTFELRPGTPRAWKNVKLTLTSVTSPPVPLLGSQFITDGTRTAIVKASASSQPVAGTVGQFQCASREKANKFDCYFPHDSCICQAHEKRASCTCTHQNLEELFTKTEHVLPLNTFGLSLMGTGNQVEAEYNQIASLELQVGMEGFRLATRTDKNKCNIKPLEFAGCYSCLSGAKLKYECKTDFGEALAHVNCGESGFSTVCTPAGLKATATMSFKRAAVKETCTVLCPAGSTTFDIDANLVFIEKERLGEVSNAISTDYEKNEFDLGFLSAWLSGNWLAGLLIVVGVIMVLILSVTLCPVIIQVVIACASRLSTGIMLGLFKKVTTLKPTPPSR